MRTLIIFFLLCGTCFAGVNEKYSYKDFMDKSFKEAKASEFNNSTIVGTCFYQNWKEGDKDIVKDIFPDDLVNVEFEKCNLDNVKIKLGMTADDTNTKKKIQVQNDLEDWILDKDLKPVEPIEKNMFLELQISVDPKDIPLTKQTKQATEKKREEIISAIDNQ